MRELYPVQGGATEGFEFKWVQNGQTYRVRVHNVDPSAPVGSNAYNGWVVRVQRGRRYFDPTINDFREAKYFNPNGSDYDEVIINDTHIPILDPYQNWISGWLMEVLRILDEKKLEELVSNMDDRIRMHDYSKEQLLLLIEDYVTINFQGMKYQTREAILNMICDAVNYYDIGKDLNWESIIAIREDLEDDLKEYVDEIISIHHN